MIRKARIEDLEQLQAIYNEAIENTTATFDMVKKDYENRLLWFEEHQADPYVIFVDEIDGKVAGYGSLSEYRDRPAFKQTVEISIYIAPEFRNRGIGKKLMKETLDFAYANPKIHSIVSLITGENQQSIHLHEMHDFEFCGKIKEAGYKFDRWLDLNIYQIKK